MGDRRHTTDLSTGPAERPIVETATRFLPWIAAAAATCIGAAVAPSPAWALAAFAIFAGFCLTLARRAPATFLLLAPLLVLRLTELGSGVAIESGAAMVETGTIGAPSGAFAHLCLLSLLVILAAAWPIERMWLATSERLSQARLDWTDTAPALAIALAALLGLGSIILAFLAIRHGVPLIGHIDRFNYLGQLEGTPYRSIMMNRPVIAPLIGVVIATSRTRRAGLGLLGWLLLMSVLFGEKFTSLLLIIGGAAAPPLLVRLAQGGRLPRRPLLLAPAMFAIISLPAILLAYGAIDDSGAAWRRLGERAAVQGQLWYLADRAGPPREVDVPALRADLISWFRPAEQHAERVGPRFGLYYVMARFTPTHRLKVAERGGTGFVFALHPYLLLAGGVVGLLLGTLMIMLTQGWALALLVRSLVAGRWLAALAFGRVINSCYASMATGYLWNIFGVKTLVTFALGLLLLSLPDLRTILGRLKPLSAEPDIT